MSLLRKAIEEELEDRVPDFFIHQYIDEIFEAFLKHLPKEKEYKIGDDPRNEGWNSYRNEIEGMLK